jgi:multidrug efflux pump subunit AcrB
MKNRLGISGGLAARFQDNALTPLLALAAMLLGVFAVIVTPREEEPQIDVTFANVFVGFPGASTTEVENLVALPMEQVLAEIDGVKHVYSVSRPGMGVLTVQFKVGEPRTEALVRLYNAIFSNQDWRPQNLGILPPIVKPKGIDDVPIVSATLWTEDGARATQDLLKVAHALEAEIKRVPGTRDVYTIGGSREIVHVELDPQRVAGFGMTLDDLRQALTASNTASHAGSLVYDNTDVPVQAGTFLSNREDVARLVVGLFEGRPVYLDDIATVRAQADQPDTYTWYATGPAAAETGIDPVAYAPSVTIAIAKKPGTNATHIANAVVERLAQLEATLIPEGVEVTITRNYGKTADDKASKLIQKLSFATMSVILLTWFALGWREAIVVGTAVIVTLAATLFASWAWGFTINRVSLFALIFAIGILVDDAIVVVENIHRHRGFGSGAIGEIIPPAVDEVGGPTILATFTVIAALLPMAFVTGRDRADGAVHEPDPYQRQHRHADLPRGRPDPHAVAQSPAAATCPDSQRVGRRGVEAAPYIRAPHAPVPGSRNRQTSACMALWRHGRDHRRRPGGARHAGRNQRRANCPCPGCNGRVDRARAGSHRLPGLRGHGFTHQLQRPGAAVLPAQRQQYRGHPSQPRRQARAQAVQPRDRTERSRRTHRDRS